MRCNCLLKVFKRKVRLTKTLPVRVSKNFHVRVIMTKPARVTKMLPVRATRTLTVRVTKTLPVRVTKMLPVRVTKTFPNKPEIFSFDLVMYKELISKTYLGKDTLCQQKQVSGQSSQGWESGALSQIPSPSPPPILLNFPTILT